MENRLAQAKSAYLRSAMDQPVDWYEFGDEAFQKARELDRPILLDIGAVWCHWCHVIDRESYENEEIAQYINEHFIAVKVDRDERPDIDSRYQNAVASMTGQGGWPLTVFLSPDGRVIYGGTYFPPATMKKLMTQIRDVWHERKTEIMKNNLFEMTEEDIKANTSELPEEVQHLANLPPESIHIPPDVFMMLNAMIEKVYDETYGGIGHYPKFPHYSLLEYMIQQSVFNAHPKINEGLQKTLTAMARGGLYDHIGGGFHRYSVDRYWHVPHFEKMAYDNAEALRVFAQAYRLYRDPLYWKALEGTLQFTREVLSDWENGGFYASQDADIDLWDDGDYFTWTIAEMREVLDEDELKLAIAHFGMTDEGNMHGRPGRNVLRIEKTTTELMDQGFGPSLDAIESKIEIIKSKLKERRNQRPTPTIDKALYLNWNGMYIGAYFEAADLLNKPELAEFARKSLDRLLTTHVSADGNRMLHVEGGVPAFLEDYAWFIHALLWAYQSTGSDQYLDQAKRWTDFVLETFEDKKYGAFYDVEAPDQNALALLKFRQKKAEDSPSSSANAIMVRNLIQLHYLTGEVRYENHAKRALAFFAPHLNREGIYLAALAIGAYQLIRPPLKLELVGKNESLEEASRRIFAPGKLLSYGIDGSESGEVRICEGYRCLKPVKTRDDLEVAIQSFVSNTVAIL